MKNLLDNFDASTYQRKMGWLYNYLKYRKPKEIIRLLGFLDMYGIDVGAGCGQYAEVMQSEGYQIVCVDPNEELLKAYSGVKYYCGGEKMPFDDKQFDFSYTINVLHHAYNPIDILREMRRVSHKIIIGELNRDNILIRAYIKLLMPFDDWDEHFSRSWIEKIVRWSGLRITSYHTSPLVFVPDVFMWFLCE